MIKINLLPVKRAPKAAPLDEAMVQMALALAVVAVFLGACGYRWYMLTDEVAQQTLVREQKTNELADLKKKVVEVENYEKDVKLLEDQNQIIEQLRKNQVGPVRQLDHLSQGLDPLKVWLTNIAEASPEITVDGRALSNDDIVEFVKNLQRANYFASGLLEESRQVIDEGVTVYQFKLKLQVRA
jgi:type IV pilus assembly protein PilN